MMSDKNCYYCSSDLYAFQRGDLDFQNQYLKWNLEQRIEFHERADSF